MKQAIYSDATPTATPSGVSSAILGLKLHPKRKKMWSSKVICKKTKVSKKSGLCPIALQVFLPGKIKKHLHFGIFVKPDKWLDSEQLIKEENELDYDNNLIIKNYRSIESNYLLECRFHRKAPTWDGFLEKLRLGDSTLNFISYFSQKIEENEFKGILKSSTAKTHRSILNKCISYKPN